MKFNLFCTITIDAESTFFYKKHCWLENIKNEKNKISWNTKKKWIKIKNLNTIVIKKLEF